MDTIDLTSKVNESGFYGIFNFVLDVPIFRMRRDITADELVYGLSEKLYDEILALCNKNAGLIFSGLDTGEIKKLPKNWLVVTSCNPRDIVVCEPIPQHTHDNKQIYVPILVFKNFPVFEN